jgi:hypothetical protein
VSADRKTKAQGPADILLPIVFTNAIDRRPATMIVPGQEYFFPYRFLTTYA